jgi:dynein assembly factor 1
LNLSDNIITKVEGLSNLVKLETLQLKRNRIGKNGLDDVIGLLECPSISVLDISDNFIEDPTFFTEVLVKMPKLAVLYLQGNGITKKIKNYRKSLIAAIPTLKYLDDRPVFDEDRRYAEAFARGGIEEERKERDVLKKEKEDAHWKNHEAF